MYITLNRHTCSCFMKMKLYGNLSLKNVKNFDIFDG